MFLKADVQFTTRAPIRFYQLSRCFTMKVLSATGNTGDEGQSAVLGNDPFGSFIEHGVLVA